MRRFPRRQAICYVALDILDHDDRVIDDDADRQDQAEQGQHVQREAEGRHDGEGRDQRHGDRRDRNDRGAPGLKKDEDYDDDQQDGFVDRVLDGLDRGCHELGRVVGDLVLDAGWKRRLQPFHLRLHGRGGGQGVGARPLLNPDADRLAPIEIGVRAVLLGAQFDAGDVAQAQEPSVRRRPDDDVRNCSSVWKRPWVVTVICLVVPAGAGGWPSAPPGTWTFWACSASITSPAARLYVASRLGSSQTRSDSSRSPKIRMSPTPLIRFSASTRLTEA